MHPEISQDECYQKCAMPIVESVLEKILVLMGKLGQGKHIQWKEQLNHHVNFKFKKKKIQFKLRIKRSDPQNI